jgi:putative hydrolase of the HAD superfamily
MTLRECPERYLKWLESCSLKKSGVFFVVIFFDLDGTLLDHKAAESEAASKFFYDYARQFNISESEFVHLWSELATKHYNRYLRKELSFIEQRRERIKELFGYMGCCICDEEADQKFDVYLNNYKNSWISYPDVIPCLEQIDSYNLGIITNGDYHHQVEKLERLGIRKFFSTIVTSSVVGIAKPNKEIFITACEKAGVTPSDCIYVGDDIEIDILGCKSAGMKGIWLNRVDSSPPITNIITIRTLHEVPELIRKLVG